VVDWNGDFFYHEVVFADYSHASTTSTHVVIQRYEKSSVQGLVPRDALFIPDRQTRTEDQRTASFKLRESIAAQRLSGSGAS
jgi:hypothetical protein